MGKEPSEKDVKKRIQKAKQELKGLNNLKEQAVELKKQLDKINFSGINAAIDEAEKAETNKNYTEAYKKADEALKLIKESEDNQTDSSLWWGWRAQILLAIIAFSIMFKLSTVPYMVYYWGILGAIAHIVFSISLHYNYRDLDSTELLFSTARIIQSPILAGAIYLVLIDLGSSQQLIYNINQTLAQGANITNPNIITTSKVSDNTLMAVSFIVGFFTETAVGFLRTLSKKLLPEQSRT
ncbi:MAG: hypothetical protein PHH85_00450 [Candidatus Methanoperedens sp.]|nr:hypothetical protein [Candidatus Methanoperedens sp.]